MSRGLTALLVVGFGAMTILAVSGRWMSGVGGVVMVSGAAMLFDLVRRRSQYMGTSLGLLWLAVCLAGLVVFIWGWL